MHSISELRVRPIRDQPPHSHGEYVLYWMTAFRRVDENHAIDRALHWCRVLRRPLLVFEPLRCDYRWASDRLHAFILDGMAENARRLAHIGVAYFPYVEPAPHAGSGLLQALASRACIVIGDDFPCFFLPRMLASAAHKLATRMEIVDANGLIPLRAADRVFHRAVDFRRWWQKYAWLHLIDMPATDPWSDAAIARGADIPGDILTRWPAWNTSLWPSIAPQTAVEADPNTASRTKDSVFADSDLPLFASRMQPAFSAPSSIALTQSAASLASPATLSPWETRAKYLATLPINHAIRPVPTPGGSQAAHFAWNAFFQQRLHRYATDRNQPSENITSGLSPYLHFGHISPQRIFSQLLEREYGPGWRSSFSPPPATGSAAGWWNLGEACESFLDQLLTWRELGYNLCWQRSDYDQFDSLPDWCKRTLAEHALDRRAFTYSLEEFASSSTHDPLWNTAQRQLVREGFMHNYLRMLWGKKVLEWSSTPRQALENLIELNNGYALDGRNPNSYSGIFWCLGRYDRPWGPERPIYGTIRYMSSENTARKLDVRPYLRRYA